MTAIQTAREFANPELSAQHNIFESSGSIDSSRSPFSFSGRFLLSDKCSRFTSFLSSRYSIALLFGKPG